MADEQTAELTREQRKRNMMRVEAAEKALGEAQDRLAHVALEAGAAIRLLHHHRGELRKALGEPELPELPPLFEQAPTAEPETKTTKRGRKDAD